jgi:hypothetical protein
MHRFRFSIIIGGATLIAASGCLGLMAVTYLLVTFLKLEKFDPGTPARLLILALEVLFPIAAAARWMFPRLAALYRRREARAVTASFALFSPVALSIGIVVGGPAGAGVVSYPEPGLLMIGVFLGTSVAAAVLLLAVCALVLRVTKLTISVESSD